MRSRAVLSGALEKCVAFLPPNGGFTVSFMERYLVWGVIIRLQLWHNGKLWLWQWCHSAHIIIYTILLLHTSLWNNQYRDYGLLQALDDYYYTALLLLKGELSLLPTTSSEKWEVEAVNHCQQIQFSTLSSQGVALRQFHRADLVWMFMKRWPLDSLESGRNSIVVWSLMESGGCGQNGFVFIVRLCYNPDISHSWK